MRLESEAIHHYALELKKHHHQRLQILFYWKRKVLIDHKWKRGHQKKQSQHWHNQHHQFFDGNYGLYFTFWDRMMGTLRADYDGQYESNKSE